MKTMQSLNRGFSNDVVRLDLTVVHPPSHAAPTGGLSIDEDEPTESRIRRLISEHPVVIFARSSCCMCHVMKNLLGTVGVHPTVIELDDSEIRFLPVQPPPASNGGRGAQNLTPALFIGGGCVGGLESLVGLHLSGHLVPKLVEVGALWV